MTLEELDQRRQAEKADTKEEEEGLPEWAEDEVKNFHIEEKKIPTLNSNNLIGSEEVG